MRTIKINIILLLICSYICLAQSQYIDKNPLIGKCNYGLSAYRTPYIRGQFISLNNGKNRHKVTYDTSRAMLQGYNCFLFTFRIRCTHRVHQTYISNEGLNLSEPNKYDNNLVEFEKDMNNYTLTKASNIYIKYPLEDKKMKYFKLHKFHLAYSLFVAAVGIGYALHLQGITLFKA